jgi:hypothetical protein
MVEVNAPPVTHISPIRATPYRVQSEQAAATSKTQPFEDDDEDEMSSPLPMSQIQLVHQLVIPKILDSAFSRDFAML